MTIKQETILGIDWGEKRIGLAISRNGIAFDYTTINFSNMEEVVEEIKRICQKEKVEKIILGLAKSKEGQFGFQAKKQKNFAAILKKKLKIKIIFEDEIFTTKSAERYLKEQNISQDKIRKLIDQKSAQLILQAYLEREK